MMILMLRSVGDLRVLVRLECDILNYELMLVVTF